MCFTRIKQRSVAAFRMISRISNLALCWYLPPYVEKMCACVTNSFCLLKAQYNQIQCLKMVQLKIWSPSTEVEILSVIESRFTSGVVQAKVFIFKINLLFSGFQCFRKPSRDLCVLIVKVALKKRIEIIQGRQLRNTANLLSLPPGRRLF